MTTQTEIFGGDAGKRSWLSAMGRGLRGRCPSCGEGRLFAGYVKTGDPCKTCGLDVSGHRADDAPPYITIAIVGHIVVPLALAAKQIFDPSLPLQFAIWLPLTVLMSWALLPASKGAMIGLQWANRMHGFEAESDSGAAE